MHVDPLTRCTRTDIESNCRQYNKMGTISDDNLWTSVGSVEAIAGGGKRHKCYYSLYRVYCTAYLAAQ